MRNFLKISLFLILAFSILWVSLGASLAYYSQNLNYYEMKFIENNTVEETDKSLNELMNIADGLRKYLFSGKEDYLRPQFNQREINHMKDVYRLFKWMFYTVAICLFVVAIISCYGINKYGVRDFLRNLTLAMLTILGCVLIIVILGSRDFSQSFLMFHQLLFTNDLWLMNPETDLMIVMLPENFFKDMALRIGLSSLILPILILITLFFNRGGRYGIK